MGNTDPLMSPLDGPHRYTIIAANDVAQLIVFLCGPASGDINGSVLPIDAGWSAG